MTTPEKLQTAAAFLAPHINIAPKIGVVLGSGLGNFVQALDDKKEIPYEQIPHFPVATVEGHHGQLILGTLAGKAVVVMAGRFHFYEGYSAEDVVFPIRVLKQLGVETLLLSNAAGGVNTDFEVGDLMIITDHISLAIVNPLIGKNDESFGPRFPDMSKPYKKHLIHKARMVAQKHDIDVQHGVYFGVTGPTFETRAEYKMIRLLGADAVGMSTVQEVIAANHAGMQVFAVSVITDMGITDEEEEINITHEEVLQAAREAEPTLSRLFRELIAAL